jgi:hypothetical protein
MDYLDRTTKFSKRLFSTKGGFLLMRSFSEMMLKGGISDESYNEMISDLQTKFNEFKLMKIKDISKVH